jgi:hypothetical protein
MSLTTVLSPLPYVLPSQTTTATPNSRVLERGDLVEKVAMGHAVTESFIRVEEKLEEEEAGLIGRRANFKSSARGEKRDQPEKSSPCNKRQRQRLRCNVRGGGGAS